MSEYLSTNGEEQTIDVRMLLADTAAQFGPQLVVQLLVRMAQHQLSSIKRHRGNDRAMRQLAIKRHKGTIVL